MAAFPAPSSYSIDTTGGLCCSQNNVSDFSFTIKDAEIYSIYCYTITDAASPAHTVTGSGTVTQAAQTVTGIDLSALDDGALNLSVTLKDRAGNTGTPVTATVTKDTVAPGAPTVTSQKTLTNRTKPTWSWTPSDNNDTNFRYRLDGGDFSSCTTDKTFTPTVNLADGEHTLYVQEEDAAGNWSASGSCAVTVDTTAPGAPLIDPTSGFIGSTTVTLTGTAEKGSTVKIIGGSSDVSGQADATSGRFSIQVTLNQNAANTLSVTAADAANNVSSPATVTITQDSVAPTVPQSSAVTADNITQSGLKLSWNAASDSVSSSQSRLKYCVLSSTDGTYTTASQITGHAIKVGDFTAGIVMKDVTGLSSGTVYYFYVVVEDEAGNMSLYAVTKVTTLSAPSGGDSGQAVPSPVIITGTTTSGSAAATIPSSDTNASAISTVTIKLGGSTVTVPSSVLASALGSGSFLTLTQTPPDSALQAKVNAVASSMSESPVLIVNFNLVSTDLTGAATAVHNLSGSVAVTITLTDAQIAAIGGDTSKAKIYYYDELTGKLTDMNAVFDLKSKTATFTTNHFSSYVLTVPDKTPPVVTGVDNDGIYNTDKTIIFNKGTATLDGSAFSSGSAVLAEGKHTLVVTDAAGIVTTVIFTIDKTAPVVTGVKNGGIYKTSKKITFSDGAATLDGNAFANDSAVSADGKHTLAVTDAAGNRTTVTFTIDKIAPKIAVRRVKGGMIVTATDKNLLSKNVTLNGKKLAWAKNGRFTRNGKYLIMATDKAGNKTVKKFKI